MQKKFRHAILRWGHYDTKFVSIIGSVLRSVSNEECILGVLRKRASSSVVVVAAPILYSSKGDGSAVDPACCARIIVL